MENEEAQSGTVVSKFRSLVNIFYNPASIFVCEESENIFQKSRP